MDNLNLFKSNNWDVPDTLAEALDGQVSVVRYGELFGAAESSVSITSFYFVGIETFLLDLWPDESSLLLSWLQMPWVNHNPSVPITKYSHQYVQTHKYTRNTAGIITLRGRTAKRTRHSRHVHHAFHTHRPYNIHVGQRTIGRGGE